MYTTCEAGKRRSVNHMRVRSLASPSRSEAVGVGEARRSVARPDGRCACAAGRDVQVRCDVMC